VLIRALLFPIYTPISLFQWDSAHPIFNSPNVIPNPLSQVAPEVYDVNAITEKAINGGVALGGISLSPKDAQAFVVIANGGRTLLNTFLLDEVREGHNGNSRPDVVDMMENEIALICPEIKPPVGGNLLPRSSSVISVVALVGAIGAVAIVVGSKKKRTI
jgi:hypothetical protein